MGEFHSPWAEHTSDRRHRTDLDNIRAVIRRCPDWDVVSSGLVVTPERIGAYPRDDVPAMIRSFRRVHRHREDEKLGSLVYGPAAGLYAGPWP